MNTSVANSRPNKKQPLVWRRRHCQNCGQTFTTEERPSLAHNITITTNDARNESFNLGRLILSIASSFSHTPEAARYDSLWLAQTVEQLLSAQRQSITPDDITAATHEVLKKYDHLAAIQYAAKHQLLEPTRRPGRPSLASRARGTRPSLSR